MMKELCGFFALSAPVRSCEPYGCGHINVTFLITCEDGKRYIMQRLSRAAFHDIPALMRNVQKVTEYLSAGCSDERGILRLVPLKQGGCLLEKGSEFYRVFPFCEHTVCLNAAEREGDLYQCAGAFGDFQKKLSGFPASELSETIPHFHDTPSRFRAFGKALKEDKLGRAAFCKPECDFVLSHAGDTAHLMDLQSTGKLPLRVTHNDTKLNNVLLDETTHAPVCVIDLDTVMPGLAAFDFGDLVRFGANTGAEDETDLNKVGLSLSNYNEILKGFLSACGDSLTKEEIASLPWGAKLMTLECGIRFLTDYLQGDTYFHIQRPNHNLDRARTQFRLVEDMEAHWAQMLEPLPL